MSLIENEGQKWKIKSNEFGSKLCQAINLKFNGFGVYIIEKEKIPFGQIVLNQIGE